MAIVDIQRRLAEIGRIRLGTQVETRTGKKRPAALDTFRLTSRDRGRIAEVAQLYGGTVTRWESPTGIPAWEVITKTDRLPVIVPPTPIAFSQFYELWSGGGCQRRCDTSTEFLSGEPCLCEAAVQEGLQRECKPITRLSVMLRDVKGLGIWRVDTTSFYASLEIPGGVDMIEFFAGRGMMLPAILRLDQRTIKRPDEPTKQFVVPVLDVDVTPGQLLGSMTAAPPTAAAAVPELPAANLTPVPDTSAPPASIADQVAAAEELPSRRKVTPIKSTGIAPRTAAQRGGTRPIAEQSDPWGPAPPPPDDWVPPNPPPDPPQTTAPAQERATKPPGREWREDVAMNRRMADQFGLLIPAGVPGHPYDGSTDGAGLRIEAFNQRSRRAATPQEEAAVIAAEEAGAEAAAIIEAEERGFEAIEAERDAATQAANDTQDPPRMATNRQLTKLSTMLTNRGMDNTKEGRQAALDFIMAALPQLRPDSPYAARTITTRKQLTFDEVVALIDMMEEDERQERAAQTPAADAPQGGDESSPEPSTDTEQIRL